MGYGGKWDVLTKWLARDKLFDEISCMKACQKANITTFHNLFTDPKNSFGKYQNYDAKIIEFSKIIFFRKIPYETFSFTRKLVTTAKMLVCMWLAVFVQLMCICV